MAEAVLEKAVCVSCGVDVRDGTQFCYACGKPVVSNGNLDESVETVDEKPVDLSVDKTEKMANAAAERKKSRVGQRKPKQVVWEEPGASSNRIFVLVCVLIAVVAAAVVFLTVFVK